MCHWLDQLADNSTGRGTGRIGRILRSSGVLRSRCHCRPGDDDDEIWTNIKRRLY